MIKNLLVLVAERKKKSITNILWKAVKNTVLQNAEIKVKRKMVAQTKAEENSLMLMSFLTE